MTDARVRLDKWLWAARLYKTRALAAEEATRGRVAVNGQPAKPARELRIGDRIELSLPGGLRRSLAVRALGTQRASPALAQGLYEESAESTAARERAAERRRLAPEPAAAIAQGRPTKRDRRAIGRAQASWQRWSASLDDT